MYLVLKPTRTEPRTFPVYSETVFHALSAIRVVQLAEMAKLNPEERREMASALQIMAIASLLELELETIGPR